MARNKVEVHIQSGAFHTFKVAEGEVVKIGDPVAVKGDMVVGVAGAGDLALGVAYGGTVGIAHQFDGDKGEVVTVVVNKPLVYLTAGGAVTAGAKVEVGAGAKVVAHDAGEALAIALTGAVADGDTIVGALL